MMNDKSLKIGKNNNIYNWEISSTYTYLPK